MLNCLKITTEDDHSSMGLIFQMLCEVYHFTQQLCLFVIQPGLVNCSAVLILRIFIQPTICSQLDLPGCPDVVMKLQTNSHDICDYRLPLHSALNTLCTVC